MRSVRINKDMYINIFRILASIFETRKRIDISKMVEEILEDTSLAFPRFCDVWLTLNFVASPLLRFWTNLIVKEMTTRNK